MIICFQFKTKVIKSLFQKIFPKLWDLMVCSPPPTIISADSSLPKVVRRRHGKEERSGLGWIGRCRYLTQLPHCSPAPNICWSHQSFPAATANQHMSNHHKAFHCCSLVLPLTNSLLLHLDQAELEKSNLLSVKDSSSWRTACLSMRSPLPKPEP